MKVIVNGEERTLPPCAHVAALVIELSLPAPLVLVERNGTALRRSEWETTKVEEGDRFEILRISAGG